MQIIESFAAHKFAEVNGDVWVFAEQQEGRLNSVTLELIGSAKKLSDALGVTVNTVLKCNIKKSNGRKKNENS